VFKALSTLSQKSETVAENGEKTATVAFFCSSLTFLRQRGQGFIYARLRDVQNLELDRLKRRINKVKGFSTAPETLHLVQQQKALTAQLEQLKLRRKALAKQVLHVQVRHSFNLSICLIFSRSYCYTDCTAMHCQPN